ncbi:alpha/beta fold hydrolase [Phreatobacter sp.]|uniref:alpha/beta fold hydrolase n=1 Tax=Phreatobacter sp. TaxID=1966341 RepID=UPI003F70D239
MSLPLVPLMAGLAVPAVLGTWTAIRTRTITRTYPPEGRFVATRAGRLHLVERGSGTPVLFLHGASGNARVWEPALGNRLDGLGRALLVDRPGHGFSERRAGRAGGRLGHQGDAMIDVLDALGEQRAVVVAHSWAGALACRMALDHPDRVAGLVLIAPATHPWPGGVHWYYRLAAMPVIGPLFAWTVVLPAGEAWMARSVQGVFAPQAVDPDYAHAAAIPLVLRPPQFIANAVDCVLLHEEVTAQAPRYPSIRCPVTVISGTSDSVVWTHLHSQGLARDIAQTRLILLDDVGHGPHHAAPDLVVEAIGAMAGTASVPPAVPA